MDVVDKALGEGTPMYKTAVNTSVKTEQTAKSVDAFLLANHSSPSHFQMNDRGRNMLAPDAYNLRFVVNAAPNPPSNASEPLHRSTVT
jgi:hypothetical protein